MSKWVMAWFVLVSILFGFNFFLSQDIFKLMWGIFWVIVTLDLIWVDKVW